MGRILNVALLADRIFLCSILVNDVRLLVLWVKRAPDVINRVPFHKLIERPHGTRIILKGASAVKEIGDCEAFYAKFGHSFEAIKVILFGTSAEYSVAWSDVDIALHSSNSSPEVNVLSHIWMSITLAYCSTSGAP